MEAKEQDQMFALIVLLPLAWTGSYFVGYDISNRQMSNGLGVCWVQVGILDNLQQIIYNLMHCKSLKSVMFLR